MQAGTSALLDIRKRSCASSDATHDFTFGHPGAPADPFFIWSRQNIFRIIHTFPFDGVFHEHVTRYGQQVGTPDSVLEFDVNNPILVESKGGSVAGHGRLLAARKIGLQVISPPSAQHNALKLLI